MSRELIVVLTLTFCYDGIRAEDDIIPTELWEMRDKIRRLLISFSSTIYCNLKDRSHLAVVCSDLIKRHTSIAIVEMLAQLIFEQFQLTLRIEADDLIEMFIVINLQEHHCSFPNILVSMFAIEPLTDLLCECFINHI